MPRMRSEGTSCRFDLAEPERLIVPNLAAAVIVKPFDPPVSGPLAIFENFRGHRFVPVTTISTCRPPQREQTSRSRQWSTDVSAPYRVAISVGSGST